ncbi:hypothetical protein NECAME_16569 [Necator americanus]|uniref:Uncharacterized protein n=1 Tax=Necator americanus TaxID=51031 RepID=W2TW78_NECAM|nr:hypothetical protein NECAME_16569 [Necator americanus]ETN85934.1 hypothetical protein NECAME_16569 [Necator americanus]
MPKLFVDERLKNFTLGPLMTSGGMHRAEVYKKGLRVPPYVILTNKFNDKRWIMHNCRNETKLNEKEYIDTGKASGTELPGREG